MKLGLITDIHEFIPQLRSALNHFAAERVDQVVIIGDVLQMGEHIEETCQLLTDAKAIGVWGNHDYGLCVDASDGRKRKHSPVVTDFMASLVPRLQVEECHFCHVEPWLNPEQIEDLWYFEGPPDQADKLARIFEAVSNQIVFAGHYHKWLLATPGGIQNWAGDSVIRLDRHERYFIVVGALCEGRYAIFDTDSRELTPYNDAGQTHSLETDSIANILDNLRLGDEAAAAKIWEECYPRLLQIARKRLEGSPRKMADEEDVALSALKSFYKAMRRGRFPDLRDRNGLWRLLFTITTRKAVDIRRYEGRRKAYGEADGNSPNNEYHALNLIPGGLSEEEVAIRLAEELELRLGNLDADLCQMTIAKLEGYTNQEIAKRFGVALRTVERRLNLVRRKWEAT